MTENKQDMATSNEWRMKSPSREYMTLAPEIRQKIEGYLLEYPVKIGAIAKQLGVKVLLSTLSCKVSGQISQENGDFIFRINRREAKYRQRFTIAHELAHFLLHREYIEEANDWSENILLHAPDQPIQIEHEANRLAFDLIIPSARLAEAIENFSSPITNETINNLACLFEVTTVVMENKLRMN